MKNFGLFALCLGLSSLASAEHICGKLVGMHILGNGNHEFQMVTDEVTGRDHPVFIEASLPKSSQSKFDKQEILNDFRMAMLSGRKICYQPDTKSTYQLGYIDFAAGYHIGSTEFVKALGLGK